MSAKEFQNGLTVQQVDDREQNVLYYQLWIKVYKIFRLSGRLPILRSYINMAMERLVCPRLKLMKAYWIRLKCKVFCPSLERFDRNLVGLEPGLQHKQLLLEELLDVLSP